MYTKLEFAVVIAALLHFPSTTRACDPDALSTVTLIGSNRDGTIVVLRHEFGMRIRVLLVDVETLATVRSLDVVTQEEEWKWMDLRGTNSEPDLKAIRSKRWHAIERELKTLGYDVYPEKTVELELKNSRDVGFALDLRSRLDESIPTVRYDIVARRAGAEVVVQKDFMSANTGVLSVQAAFRIPAIDKIIAVGDQCFENPPLAIIDILHTRELLDSAQRNSRAVRQPTSEKR